MYDALAAWVTVGVQQDRTEAAQVQGAAVSAGKHEADPGGSSCRQGAAAARGRASGWEVVQLKVPLVTSMSSRVRCPRAGCGEQEEQESRRRVAREPSWPCGFFLGSARSTACAWRAERVERVAKRRKVMTTFAPRTRTHAHHTHTRARVGMATQACPAYAPFFGFAGVGAAVKSRFRLHLPPPEPPTTDACSALQMIFSSGSLRDPATMFRDQH